ncbi:MAG: hypothetical protein RBS39_08300 [Phycisphaerales bacterium]|nr:hypothetical protein [Phycisphaerales bacterium]
MSRCAILVSAAALAATCGVASAQLKVVSKVSKNPNAVTARAVTGTGPTIAAASAACDASYWENGAFDGLNGQSSESGTGLGADAETADDFSICEGKAINLQTIRACLLTNTSDLHWPGRQARLTIYTDCDGCPGEPIYTADTDDDNELGGGIGSFALVEYTFSDIDLWLCGPAVYWISVQGLGDHSGLDRAFWATAGFGEVQLHQGKFRTDKADIATPGWVDVGNTDGCESCIGCTDFCFNIDAEVCDILWDNGEFAGFGGGPSALNTSIPMARSADNFHLKPCDDYDLCFISGCILTNCDPKRTLLEIYENDCDMPAALRGTWTDPVITSVEVGPCADAQDLGDLVAYNVLFSLEDYRLEGGKNYWVALVARGTGSLREQGFFCYAFRCDTECQILITEGKVLSMGLGYADWTPVSDVTGYAYDFSFKVVGNKVSTQPPAGTPRVTLGSGTAGAPTRVLR